MTVEFARRLLSSEVVSASDMEAALLQVVELRVSLVQALAERGPELGKRVERELERLATKRVDRVRAAPELAGQLPPGMCERLLAVPIGRDGEAGVVDVACADSLDAHVQAEFAFHLQADVRTVRAPLSEISAAIEGLHAGGSFLQSVSRVLGGAAQAPDASAHDSPKQAGSAEPAEPPESAEPHPSEPPIPLVRKSLSPRAVSGPSSNPLASEVLRISLPVAPAPIQVHEVKPASEIFEKLGSADEVMEALLAELARLAPRVAIFAVKGSTFEGRMAKGMSLEQIRAVHIPQAEPSLLRTAFDRGHYLGPVTSAEANAALAMVRTAESKEVYAVRVSVSGRAAIIAVISGFQDPFAATRAADELVSAVSQALERVVRSKKSRR